MHSFCYIDGEITSGEGAKLPVSDLGLQRGFGVFDFMRTYNGKLFHPKDHLQRFRRSAAELNLEVPLPDEDLLAIGRELLERSDLSHPALKYILTGGDAPPSSPYGQPRLVIIAENHPVYPAEVYEEGVHLLPVHFRRELPHVKSLNYMNSLRYQKQLDEKGAFDLVYYDNEGGVTETPRANLFMVKEGILVTPSRLVLEGITKGIITHLAARHYDVEERPLSMEELFECEEIFICSTSKRIIPVARLDGKPVGNGRVGTVTRHIMQLFDTYTGNW